MRVLQDNSRITLNERLQYLERFVGLVVRALVCGVEGPRIEITLDWVSGKLSLFTKQQMDTGLSSELGKV